MDYTMENSNDRTRPAFRVTTRIPYDQKRNQIKYNDLDEFWATLLDARTYKSDNAPETNQQFERSVALGFGREMKQKLADYFWQSWGHDKEHMRFHEQELSPMRDTLLTGVFFEAKHFGYSSFSFDVEIEGMKKLGELFGANLDLLLMVLRSYVPIAFQNTIGIGIPNHILEFDICPNSVMVNAMKASSNSALKENPSKGSNANSNATGIWIVTNFSLVVPAVLALLVAYGMVNAVSDERKDLFSFKKEYLTQQKALIEVHQKRDAAYDEIEQTLLQNVLTTIRTQQNPKTADGTTTLTAQENKVK